MVGRKNIETLYKENKLGEESRDLHAKILGTLTAHPNLTISEIVDRHHLNPDQIHQRVAHGELQEIRKKIKTALEAETGKKISERLLDQLIIDKMEEERQEAKSALGFQLTMLNAHGVIVSKTRKDTGMSEHSISPRYAKSVREFLEKHKEGN